MPCTLKRVLALLLVLCAEVPIDERVVKIPLEVGKLTTQFVTLEATVYKPTGPGPFPLVVINHGASGKADPSPRWRPAEQAAWFVERGFAVVVPMRRGNAGSEGEWAEGFGTCESADYFSAALESARDILAAVDFMARQPFIDGSEVLLIGHSAGGFGALAAASLRPKGIKAVINFAGGRGSWSDDDGLTRHNCSPEALVEAAKKFGSTIRIPTFWLYSKNDAYFPPKLARQMFAAFAKQSRGAHFVELSPFQSDGHAIFWNAAAMPLWTQLPEVTALVTR